MVEDPSDAISAEVLPCDVQPQREQILLVMGGTCDDRAGLARGLELFHGAPRVPAPAGIRLMHQMEVEPVELQSG